MRDYPNDSGDLGYDMRIGVWVNRDANGHIDFCWYLGGFGFVPPSTAADFANWHHEYIELQPGFTMADHPSVWMEPEEISRRDRSSANQDSSSEPETRVTPAPKNMSSKPWFFNKDETSAYAEAFETLQPLPSSGAYSFNQVKLALNNNPPIGYGAGEPTNDHFNHMIGTMATLGGAVALAKKFGKEERPRNLKTLTEFGGHLDALAGYINEQPNNSYKKTLTEMFVGFAQVQNDVVEAFLTQKIYNNKSTAQRSIFPIGAPLQIRYQGLWCRQMSQQWLTKLRWASETCNLLTI